ncbi:MAG: hypothetical protein JW997_07650 [Actinobacteria bacterium]|nr:hypothetical protein [Actinomycetota bacterium]
MQASQDIENITSLLREKGPLTGKEILDRTGLDVLLLWRICNSIEEIFLKITGQKYLRLDKRVEGFARLSPSIMREFLTYTVAGLKKDFLLVEKKAEKLSENIEKISKDKLELVKEVIVNIVMSQNSREEIKRDAVFIIAGDIVYDMAHAELRPESSTGEMVRGSDLDIIIIYDKLDKNIILELDRSIYESKYHLLKNPVYREEIDYIIKDIAKVIKQLKFDTFEHMVASKILDEGVYIYGSMKLFEQIKKMLAECRIPEKLKNLEKTASIAREIAWSWLLKDDSNLKQEKYKNLFYTKEETEEIF